LSRSIYWKITLPLIALVLVVMGVLGYYVVSSSRADQISRLASQLTSEARLVADISVPGLIGSVDGAGLDAIAKRVGSEIRARITLIAPDGTVLGDTDEDPATLANHATRPEVIAALATGTGRATRYSATRHENMMYVAVAVKDQGNTVGIARVALPLTAVESSVNRTIAAVAAGFLVAAALLVIAAALLTRMITRPLARVSAAAEAMASGKMEQQLPVRTDDELGRLSRVFNEMSASIKRTMGVLAYERSRLEDVLSGLTDGVILTDAEGKVVLANTAAERIFNFRQAAARGRPLIEAVADHEVDELVKQCIAMVHEQSVQIDTVRGRFVRAVAVPMPTDETKGALVLFQDLTELRNLQTMRREFVGNVSHELRTPLAAIKAMVETLRGGAINDPPAAADFLDRLDVEVDGMSQMVNELIELSRIETGRIHLNLEPVDLNQLVREVLDRLRPQAARQQLALTADLAPGLPVIQADGERIRQVIINIVHNAVKFTPPGGQVVVSTRSDVESAAVEVADTGIGISREDLPHIFERFFKADRSRASSGTGLGLAIAKHTVQVHGGTIWVRSEEGRGSTFGFKLPLKTDLVAGEQRDLTNP
jgi:two-component system phosphate regulon sensor histidine kinase PhoR